MQTGLRKSQGCPDEEKTALLIHMYRTMRRIRRFEEVVADLVAAGEAKCPCHLYIGQEAIAVGVCAALKPEDTIWGNHRSHGHYLAKGGDMQAMMAEILGRQTGCAGGRGGSMHLVAKQAGILGTVPIVAGTIPLAVGAALAYKLQGKRQVAVAFLGDGATEEGHFFESVNLAALYRLPLILVIENNLYASHLHLSQRRPLDNLDQIGALFGIPGVRVDGNDVVTVYRTAVEAVDRARTGQGASLLECRTYRWRGHVGHRWDEDVGVKRRDELQEWLQRCPIERLRRSLLLELGISEELLNALDEEVEKEVESALHFARQSPFPAPETVGEYVYS